MSIKSFWLHVQREIVAYQMYMREAHRPNNVSPYTLSTIMHRCSSIRHDEFHLKFSLPNVVIFPDFEKELEIICSLVASDAYQNRMEHFIHVTETDQKNGTFLTENSVSRISIHH